MRGRAVSGASLEYFSSAWCGRVYECADGAFVRGFAVEGVRAVELGGAVQLEDRPAASPVREEVDADEISSKRARGFESEALCPRWWGDRAAAGAEGDVGAPFSGCGDAVHCPDDMSGGDYDAEVVSLGPDELLDEGALADEPFAAGDGARAAAERLAVRAAVDVYGPSCRSGA
jgi:hypothetical protein